MYADFEDLSTVNLTLLATIFGTIRNVFERDLSAAEANAVHRQLVLMGNTYLLAVSKSPTSSAANARDAPTNRI